MMTEEQRELMIEILTDTERLDKISVRLDRATRSVVVEYSDLDDEWFKLMEAVTPNAAL